MPTLSSFSLKTNRRVHSTWSWLSIADAGLFVQEKKINGGTVRITLLFSHDFKAHSTSEGKLVLWSLISCLVKEVSG